ncbi:MAG: hypothetical protein Kow0059_07290 [Candidatus Sumerlaeia bacterium]
MKRIIPGWLKCVVIVGALILSSGCFGLYDNTDLFLNDPPIGGGEVDMLKNYGTPAFVANTGDRRVYTYKVRNVMYIICVGLYEGYDMAVVVRDGKVEEVKKVERPTAFTLFQPLPWAVAD